jgi:predicted Zn finger-like uncharacterized protein
VLTQCPNCDTTFRVTSEILRVAQGQVRCGRCETQFDALERLIEDDEEDTAEDEGFENDEADLRLSEPDPEEDIAVEEETADEWVELDDLETQEVEASPDADEIEPGEPQREEELAEEDEPQQQFVDVDAAHADEPEQPEEFEEEEEEEEVEEEEEFEAAREPEPAAEFVAPRAARNSYVAEPTERRASAQLRPPVSRPTRTLDDPDQFMLNSRPVRIPAAPMWRYLAIPLALLFGFQVLNHYRAPLARHPKLGGAVTGFYRMLGVELIPDWNLRAYEIKQWGAVSDPSMPGTLTVRASVRNRAAFPQPYPLVKLVLEDRFGGTVRAREFEPIEYLAKPPPPNTLMASQQEIGATIAIVDPGPDAEGFTVDVCLQGNNGSVCADDVPQTP